MPMRHRPMLLAAVVSVLLASGCLTTSPGGVTVEGENRITGGTTAKKLESSALRGTIVVPDSLGKGPGKLSVQAVNQALKRYPNTSAVTTDAAGKFRLPSVPANTVLLVTTEVGSVTLAGLAMPLPRKEAEAEVTINYASTVAVAGVLPLFAESEEHSAFVPDDMPLDLFDALVKAIAAAPADVELAKDLRAMAEPFNEFKAKNAPVKAAYDALLAKCKENLKARLEQRPVIQNPTGQKTPTPGPTATATATVAPNDSNNPTTAPKTYDPIVGTFTQVGTKVFSMRSDGQMVSLTNPLNANDNFVLIPDGTSVVQLAANDTMTTFELGNGISKVYNLALNLGSLMGGNYKAHAIGEVNGVLALITIDLMELSSGGSVNPVIKPLSGIPIQGVSSLVYSAAKSTLYAASPIDNMVVKIHPTDGTVTAFAGGTEGATLEKTAAANFRFKGPTGLVLDESSGGILYIAERSNLRLCRLTLSDEMVEPISGDIGSSSLVNNKLGLARFGQPNSLALDSAGKLLYVSDFANNALRRVDLTNDEVLSYATAATAAQQGSGSVTSPRAVIKMNGPSGRIYAMEHSGKLFKFVPN